MVMAVVLLFPAVAVADGVVSIDDRNDDYLYTAATTNESLIVEVGQDTNGTNGYWFHQGAIPNNITGACEGPMGGGNGRVCGPGAGDRIVLNLNGGDDSADVHRCLRRGTARRTPGARQRRQRRRRHHRRTDG